MVNCNTLDLRTIELITPSDAIPFLLIPENNMLAMADKGLTGLQILVGFPPVAIELDLKDKMD